MSTQATLTQIHECLDQIFFFRHKLMALLLFQDSRWRLSGLNIHQDLDILPKSLPF